MVNISTVLNRLQQFIKDNDITQVTGDMPTGISFTTDGKVIIKHISENVKIEPTLGKAANYIHHRLDELEKAI